MTVAGQQRWAAPTAQAPAIQPPTSQAPVAFQPLSWWLVLWRARVHEASTGNVDACLSALADAIGHSDAVGGLAGVHRLGTSGVSFEFRFEARTEREAAGGARLALRQACRTAGVGDPTPPSRHGLVGVMVGVGLERSAPLGGLFLRPAPPNRTCEFPRIRLSTCLVRCWRLGPVSTMRRCCPGSGSARW